MTAERRLSPRRAEPAALSPRTISSLQNERVKLVRALEMRKVRRETGLFVAEGAAVIASAKAAGWRPEMLLYRAGAADTGMAQALLEWALAERAECLEVTEAVLAKVAAKENPQTMLAVFRQRWAPLPSLAELRPEATWLALEEVRDPGNLGTILRTVHAVGAAGVILAGQCCDPWARECARATMGSIFSVPLVRATLDELRTLARTWPGDTVATRLDAGTDFRRVTYRGPVLLMMGSEGPGLTAETAAVARVGVKIPMVGALDSLNLAVATALTLYRIRDPWLDSF
jgi:TrmH family RNA methyltransferase